MPTLTRGLADLATRTGRQLANRQLTARSIAGSLGRAARSYAGRLAAPFRRDEAVKNLQSLARQIAPNQRSGPPPVQDVASQQAARQQQAVLPAGAESRYSPATERLRELAAWILGRSTIGDQEAQQLALQVVNLLRMARADAAVGLDQRRALEDIAVWLEHRFQPPAQRTGAPASEQDEDEIQVLGRADLGAWTDRQIQEAMKGEIFTPGSSNVYSFFWSADTPMGRGGTGSTNGTLFVTFKLWYPGMKAKERPNRAGPTYAYSNVPLRKYQAFEHAAEGSAGSAVWDYLRVRGSRFGHQHPYRLSAGAMVPAGGEYVPRKVTSVGLARRSLLDPRAGANWSTLPAYSRVRFNKDAGKFEADREQSFSYAEWREIAAQRNLEHARNVDRGRGAVDRGRP